MAPDERPRDGEAGGVAVIGAGIVGLSAAVFLQRGGASVTLFDPLPPPGGASWGNAGLLSVDSCVPISLPGMLWKVPGWLMDPLGPLAVDPRYFMKAAPWLLDWARAGRMRRVLAASDALRALHKPALEQYRELLGPEHFRDLIRTSGQIHVWDDGRESANERVSRLVRERHGIVAEPLDRNELRQFVPEIAPGIGRALFYPNNGQTVNPQRLVERVAGLFGEAGGVLRHERVMKILPEQGTSYSLLTNSGNHRFGKVVVAAGAWSRRLLGPLGIRIPLETERGYHVTVRDPSFTLRIPVLHKGRGFGATPMEMGIRFAGTVEIAGLEAPMNERRAHELLRQARGLFPSFEARDFSIWMGFRPSLPDSVPVIDEPGPHLGLVVACGHGHTGMTAGAMTGRLVSELVLGKPPLIDLAPYRLARFH